MFVCKCKRLDSSNSTSAHKSSLLPTQQGVMALSRCARRRRRCDGRCKPGRASWYKCVHKVTDHRVSQGKPQLISLNRHHMMSVLSHAFAIEASMSQRSRLDSHEKPALNAESSTDWPVTHGLLAGLHNGTNGPADLASD